MTSSVRNAADDRAKVEWVVRAPEGATLKLVARHDRAGAARVELELR